MPQSPDNFRSNNELGMRLLRENARSFADGLTKSGLLSPGVVIDIREPSVVYGHSEGFNFDPQSYTLSADNGETKLPPIRGDIMNELVRSVDTVVRNEILVKKIWGYENISNPGALIKGHVALLRGDFKKIGIGSTLFLRNVRGVGYMLTDNTPMFTGKS